MKKLYPEGWDQSVKEYFNSLPAVFQEQIMQSGVDLSTREQMENYCRNVLDREENSAR